MHRPDPIWAYLREEGRYNLVWLARRTGYSHSHVKAIASGKERPGPKFRRACADLLGLAEAELFHTDEPSSAAAPEDPPVGSIHRAGVAVA